MPLDGKTCEDLPGKFTTRGSSQAARQVFFQTAIRSHMFLHFPSNSHAVRSGSLRVNVGRVCHCTSVTRMNINTLPGLESCFYVMRRIPFRMAFHILQHIHCLASFLQIMKMPRLVLQEQRFCQSKAKIHPATRPLILLCSTLCAH